MPLGSFKGCEPGANAFVEQHFFDCIYTRRDAAGFSLGMASILVWLVAQMPQFISNIKNQSAEALSIWFLMQWFAGDTLNLLGCLIQGEQLPTTTFLAIYFILIDVVMLLQFIYFRAVQRRKEAARKAKRRTALLRKASSGALPPGGGSSTSLHHHHHHHAHHRHQGLDGQLGAALPSTAAAGPSLLLSSGSDALPGGVLRQGAGLIQEAGVDGPSPALARQNGGGTSAGGGGGAGGGRAGGSSSSGNKLSAAVVAVSGVALCLVAWSSLSGHGPDRGGGGGGLLGTQQHQQVLYGSSSLSRQQLGIEPPEVVMGGGSGSGGLHPNVLDGVMSGSALGRASGGDDDDDYGGDARRCSFINCDVALVAGTAMGYLATLFYLGSRVSQILKNMQRHTAEGLSVLMFMLTITANLCTGLSICLRLHTSGEFHAQLPWLCGTFGTISLDVVLFYQAYKYNARANAPGGGVHDANKAPGHHHHHHTHAAGSQQQSRLGSEALAAQDLEAPLLVPSSANDE